MPTIYKVTQFTDYGLIRQCITARDKRNLHQKGINLAKKEKNKALQQAQTNKYRLWSAYYKQLRAEVDKRKLNPDLIDTSTK